MRAPQAKASNASGSSVIRRLLSGAAIAGLTAVTMAGCGDKITGCNDCGGFPPPPFTYPALDTPQHVILNLKYSWERRDSLRTKLIYDDAYQGTSTDNRSGDPPITFTKQQEVSTVWAMGKSQDIASVSFTLRPESTWVRLSYPSDPAGWTAVQLQGVNIHVEDLTRGTLIASPTFFEFKFIPTLDAASPTDTTWKIVRWTEVKN